MADKMFWFQSEQGILRHYAKRRDRAEEDHIAMLGRINKEEQDMLDAFRESREQPHA